MPTALIKQRLFTVSEYYAMARAGILGEDDRVELIDGQIIAKAPIGSSHAACVDRLSRLFVVRVGNEAIVRVQNPIRLDNHSEPEPDLALIEPKDIYAARHPRPDEVFLVVEVGVTTLPFDREVKVPLYAQAGVSEVWVLALEEGHVYVYRRLEAGGYAEETTVGRGDVLGVESLPAAGSFSVDEMLGP